MKPAFLFLVSLLIFSCASNRKSGASATQGTSGADATGDAARAVVTGELAPILEEFEQSVIRHNKPGILSMLDAEYKQKEHDSYYQGHTDDFLNDLFCGQVVDTNQIHCLPFEEVIAIKRMHLDVSENSATVHYRVKTARMEIETALKITIKRTVTFGILGSRGLTQVE